MFYIIFYNKDPPFRSPLSTEKFRGGCERSLRVLQDSCNAYMPRVWGFVHAFGGLCKGRT